MSLSEIKNKVHQAEEEFSKTIGSTKIIAVSKTFKLDQINPLIDHGHIDFGENKVQEAVEKWTDIKKDKSELKIHLVGRLQTNKVKFALKVFDYIHSLDSKKLAEKISEEQAKHKIKPKIFIQINIGDESQKGGIRVDELEEFYNYCVELELEIIGTMCLPPISDEPEKYFSRMNYLNKKLNFKESSMGMSSDYLEAIQYNATYLRIGTSIFGERTI